MTVAITGSITDTKFAGTADINVNCNIPSNCDLALIALGYGIYGQTPGPTVSSGPTLGGNACTLWANVASTNGTDFGKAAYYYLKNPPTGASVNLVISMSANCAGHATLIPLTGSHPTAWQGTAQTGAATSTAVAVLATVAQVGGLVLDTVGCPADALTVDASQTQLWNSVDGVSGHGTGSSKSGAASVDMLWTLADSRPWAQVVVPVNPVILPPDEDFWNVPIVQPQEFLVSIW